LKPYTRMVFVETIANPRTQVADLAAIGELCRALGIVYIVDNTMTSPYLFSPRGVHASLIINSLTKCIGGHGNALGGAVTDTGLFDWSKYPNIFDSYKKGDPSRWGIWQIRKKGLRDGGASLGSEAAHHLAVGAETLALRMDKISANAMIVAQLLESHPQVHRVYFPGLPSHAQHERAKALFRAPGGLLAFELDEVVNCFDFLNRLRVIVCSSNLADNRTLAIPVAHTIYFEMGAAQRASMGIADSLIRLSVGIEDSDDLVSDFKKALTPTAAEGTRTNHLTGLAAGARGMTTDRDDPAQVYSGSVPALYDRYRGPVFFEPFAHDLSDCLANLRAGTLLEIAAGTGIVTRVLARVLPETVSIIATDINQAMLDFAVAQPNLDRIAWRQADALALPFDDAAFDAVVCQFGVMFFPDKVAGYREARRVLKTDGRFVFNVWDRIENNEFCLIVIEAMARLFPNNPPDLLTRTPYGYFDTDQIRNELTQAGFVKIAMQTVTRQSASSSARDLAIGFCQGSPLRTEIEERDPSRLGEATDAATKALLSRFGDGPIAGKMRAHMITAAV
jgi:SAM-dependent methyltransferase